MSETETKRSLHFLEQIIEEDLAKNGYTHIHTRFPPEPNGYLHIGHAKSICLNFGLAKKYGGKCNLRFDDTNPLTEETEYVQSIEDDIKWLGFDWEDREYFTSDYFDRLFDWAVILIEKGLAYVCDMSAEEVGATRGTPTVPGQESPGRKRTKEENLDLFMRMKNGEFPDGAKTLRARIDMASPNMHLRDPALYRIRKVPHHRTGDKWCIYPMYDWAHGQSDAIEQITHSICTLEFEVHRPLYDWFVTHLELNPRPKQIEFARLNLNYTVMSKRKLLRLVKEKYVEGWDDPRMPTIRGLRRRGYTPESIREFCDRVGVARREHVIDVALLEFSIREHLNKIAPRVMAVLNPLKVVITNYPEDQVEEVDAVNNPEDPGMGSRKLPFTKELYIERDDFMEDPPKKYFRLSPGTEVRLRYAYFITCQEAIKNDKGEIIELRCTYDPASKGGNSPDGRKVKGTIHWVSAKDHAKCEVRLYDRLFKDENPNVQEDFIQCLNPESVQVLKDAVLERSLADAQPGARFQFERLGYFCVDTKHSQPGRPVFNRTVTLKDTWGKMAGKE
ncbi:MAG: glutamine--tRNA ligase/YqeY domain fusion protein [Flavobacteriales bacterium]|nr:glutamine--tRNA ligase/YqeY domain fusion protein [Flavobacteriales bacterium]MCB9449518.1 glutamine--tRNA ligase/YqeY domain fusion protein [Flavobacteriales bacterium]